MDTKDSMHPDVAKGYADAEKAHISKEFERFKQDCRKRALDAGIGTASRNGETLSTEKALIEANKYYLWLITIPADPPQ